MFVTLKLILTSVAGIQSMSKTPMTEAELNILAKQIAGQKYYATFDGIINTNESEHYIGQAISNNKIMTRGT